MTHYPESSLFVCEMWVANNAGLFRKNLEHLRFESMIKIDRWEMQRATQRR